MRVINVLLILFISIFSVDALPVNVERGFWSDIFGSKDTAQSDVLAQPSPITQSTSTFVPIVSAEPSIVATNNNVQVEQTPTTTKSSWGSFFGQAVQGAIKFLEGDDETNNSPAPAPATPVVSSASPAITLTEDESTMKETTVLILETVTEYGDDLPSSTIPPQAASTTTSGLSHDEVFSLLLGSGSQQSSSASTQSAPQPTAGVSFQGGSPGMLSGSIDVSTATAINGGSSQGAQVSVGAKGITYSPYTKSGQCKTAAEVASDIAKLSDFDLIRLYSTDCSGIENVLAAINSNQQLFLGVWTINPVQNELNDIVNAIGGSSRGWGVVHTIAIGNELVNSGAATVGDIQSAVSAARQYLKTNAPDYNGYIVSVDTLVAVVANPALCQVSDYLAVNSHPYWDGNVDPSNSGPWLEQQIANLQGACGSDKQVLITETGWPTQGQPYGNCVPSVANQVSAIQSIVQSLGSKVFVFTMYNDYWKDPGPYGVEQHWGVFGDPSV
ncbi:uncharacterized protein J8A68_004359 [[Candida] subhashii]|uniref:Uncharacterized protein n=1 Tax=[Candida] subhashii TaxID=561895 RepID=A0A8J5QFP5_9ASCO|nr:uncharacterized protein J8A68_004359 [[Candida] subhashii]KAG7662097.1 hypothetical protein J8A68_004359 [[Candida] subhashii]